MLKLNIVIGFILSNVFIFYLTQIDKNNRIDKVLQDYQDRLQTNYKVLSYNEIKTADMVFKYFKKKSIDILAKVKDATKEEKAILREKLYDRVFDRYLQLRERWGVYQLQFTLPDNKVFLRVHKPDKFDDSLENIRYGVKYVNQHKKILRGFEGGKTSHAVRNIYPLFDDDGIYLGLVEISFTTFFMVDFFSQANKLHTHILINKDTFKNEIWNSEDLNLQYSISSEHEDYYLLLTTEHNKDICVVNNNKKIESIKDDIKRYISQGEAFSLYINNNETDFYKSFDNKHIDLVSFVPILNTKKTVSAWIVAYEIDRNIPDIVYYTNIFRIFTFIMSFIIFYFLYKILSQKNVLRVKVEEKTDELNSSLNNIKAKQLFIETLMDNTPIPIFYKDINGVYLGINKEFTNMFGFTKDQIVGKTVYDITSKDVAKQYYEKDIEVFNDPSVKQEYDTIIKNKYTGQKFDVYFHKKAYQDEYGETIGLIGAVIDVTKRKKNEKELTEYSAKLFELNHTLENKVYERTKELKAKTEQMIHQAKLAQMGELISMIAHQWRQPLGSIGSAVVNIQNKLFLDKFDLSKDDDQVKFKEFLQTKLTNISRYTDFLTKTIDDFRNFYKEDKNKDNLLLSSCVEQSLSVISSSLSGNNIEVVKDFCESSSVDIFKNELLQVLLNIIKNSEDNFKEKDIENKKISIKTYQDEVYSIIAISDNGGGIKSSILKNIFDPYFSTKDQKNGTGLGLYMSKLIVEDHHNGIIEVENKDDGVEFVIKIPKT